VEVRAVAQPSRLLLSVVRVVRLAGRMPPQPEDDLTHAGGPEVPVSQGLRRFFIVRGRIVIRW
jgi:hypothetical protein